MVKTRDLTDFFPKRKKALLRARAGPGLGCVVQPDIEIEKFPGTFYDKKIFRSNPELLDLGDLSSSSRNFLAQRAQRNARREMQREDFTRGARPYL